MAMSVEEELVRSRGHWHQKFEIFPGVITQGSYDPRFLWDKIKDIQSYQDARVIDIGASDGYFSKCFVEQGAEVVSVDYRHKSTSGFAIMEKLSGRTFDHRQCNIYDLTTEEFGEFDVVMLFGVLYHLPDMLRALYITRQLCRRTLLIETACMADREDSAALYHRADIWRGDVTNFWLPTLPCVRDMLYDAGFDIRREATWGDRAFVEAVISDRPKSEQKLAIGYGKFAKSVS